MKAKLTKEQIQKEIEEMDGYLPVSKIEERLGMPPTTLQKVLSGKRELPKKWYKALEDYFVRKPLPEPAPEKVITNPVKWKTKEGLPPVPPKTEKTIEELQAEYDSLPNKTEGWGKKRALFLLSEIKKRQK